MEAIENMDGLTGFFGDDFEIRLPHVAADELEFSGSNLSQPVEESQCRFDFAVLSDPQQSTASLVDLIDECEVLMSSLPLDLIESDGGDSIQIHVCPSPFNRHFHGTEDRIPTRTENLGHVRPAQQLRPSRKIPLIGRRHMILSIGPRYLFDNDATPRAFDSPHGVKEKDRNSPQRNKLEAASWQCVVTRHPNTTTRTNGVPVGPCMDINYENRSLFDIDNLHTRVIKSLMLLDPIQDSLDLHSVLSSWGDVVLQIPSSQDSGRSASLTSQRK